MTKCVHTEHCCRLHGCKYGDRNCPVWLGYKVQSYICESCCWCGGTKDGAEPQSVAEIVKPTFAEYERRRNEN